MLISLNWLSNFLDIKKSPQEIADKITLSLSEVERIKKVGNDIVFEIENKALTHRPDCFSHLGIAREIAAFYALKLNDPLNKLDKESPVKGKVLPLNIKITDQNLCIRYTAIVLKNIRIGESPDFICDRLKACGVRPINNVVDITNYVMLELGQPLHAFDYDKVNKHQVIVRLAKKTETITTLDGVKRKLDSETLVIADSQKPIALAGVMGGSNSEVSSNTKTLIIESANFNAQNIRKSSKRLNLRTEAVTRFEKNLDPNLTKAALIYAVKLLQQYAQAEVSSRVIDIYPKEYKSELIQTSTNFINSLLGLKLTSQKIISLITRLQIKSVFKGDQLKIFVPTFRRDLHLPADIAEEVARIYGYDNIPTTLLAGEIKPPPVNNSLSWERKIKLFLSGLGLTEVNLPSFISKEIIILTGDNPNHYLKLLNPLSPEKEYLRKSLLQGLLLAAQNNLKYFNKISIFEIDRIFIPTKKEEQPKEIKTLSVLFVGKSYTEAKGILEALFDYLYLPFPNVEQITNHNLFQPEQTAKIADLGSIGELNLDLRSFLNTNKEVTAFEMDFTKLIQRAKKVNFYQPIALYPPIIEDFSFEFSKDIQLGEVLSAISKISPVITAVDVVDKYESTITFRITFQDPKKSLTTQEIIPVRKQLVAVLKEKYRATLKGKV